MFNQDDPEDPPIPQFHDEDLAPSVDEILVRALVRRELDPESAREVYRFVFSFRSWNEVYTRLLVEDFHHGQHEGEDSAPQG